MSRALEAIATGRNRILLTLATGTGKTSIAFQIIWKQFQARWNLSGEPSRRPRILFLADRNTLADQAFNDFTCLAAFEDNAMARLEPDALRKKGRVPTDASVFHHLPDLHERAGGGRQALTLVRSVPKRLVRFHRDR